LSKGYLSRTVVKGYFKKNSRTPTIWQRLYRKFSNILLIIIKKTIVKLDQYQLPKVFSLAVGGLQFKKLYVDQLSKEPVRYAENKFTIIIYEHTTGIWRDPQNY
jgi:hypothetical protein